jgi:DnaJ-class molecular chaperone
MIISAAKVMEASNTLGVLTSELTPDKLSAAYRTKCKEHHPDTGDYNPELWAKISWAKDVLVRYLESNPPAQAQPLCRACSGKGRVPVGPPRAFGTKQTTMQCVICGGNGQRATMKEGSV